MYIMKEEQKTPIRQLLIKPNGTMYVSIPAEWRYLFQDASAVSLIKLSDGVKIMPIKL